MSITTDQGGPARSVLLAGALALAAAVAVCATANIGMVKAYRRLLTVTQPDPAPTPLPDSTRHLPAAQRLVLEGDPARVTRAERQRALWESAPTNAVYFHHYLTVLLADYDSLGTNAEQRYERLLAEVRQGEALDPDNARLDFVLAAKLLDQAVESKATVSGIEGGKAKVRSEMIIKRRSKIEEAMRLLQRGLAKPVYRRYIGGVLGERIALLGPPLSFSDQVQRLGLAAETPMPDFLLMRNLSRGAAAYAALLAGEKRGEEAQVFLGAWKPLTRRLIEDSYSLVDVLMAAAMAKEAEIRVPDIYRQTGHPKLAEAMLKDAAALTAPIQDWNARRNAAETDPVARRQREAFMQRTGIPASMLLPALTEFPAADELAPSRGVDYVLFDGLFITGLALLMLATMAFWTGWLMRARRRLAGADLPAGASVWRAAAVKVFWCVVLPLAVFFAVTRLTPFSGRGYGLPYAWPKAIVQLETLAVAMFLLRYVLNRAEAAGAAGLRPRVAAEIYLACLALLLAVALCIPVSLFNARREVASMVAMILPLAALAVGVIVHAIAVWLAHKRSSPAERWQKAMVTVVALGLGILVLTVGGHGYLRAEERRLVQREVLLKVAPEQGGFTVAEARLTRMLRERMLESIRWK